MRATSTKADKLILNLDAFLTYSEKLNRVGFGILVDALQKTRANLVKDLDEFSLPKLFEAARAVKEGSKYTLK